MNTISKAISQIRGVVTLPLLAVFVALGSQAFAKDDPPEQVTIIAHLPLPGTTVSQMFLQPENGKQYLYLQQASERGFTVVDVTKPSKPALTKRSAFPNTASEGKLQVFRDGFAIAETPETHSGTVALAAPAKVEPAADAARTQSVRVLDLSDPANPRTLKTFDGVTSLVSDNGRNLIYLTNSEGLWILRHKRPPAHQICDSESGFSPIADCYAY